MANQPDVSKLQDALASLSSRGDLSAVNSIAVRALQNGLLKKYLPNDTVTDLQISKAVQKFMWAQKACIAYKRKTFDESEGVYLEAIRRKLCSWIGDYALSDNYPEAYNIGPGASIGVKYNDIYSKLFESPLTATSKQLQVLYKCHLHRSQVPAELKRFERFGDRLVKGSRLSVVPKNDSIGRVICTEPLANMMAQKAIGAHLEQVLERRLGICLEKQPDVNRVLAQRGSIDGSFGTIDLESASDTISLTLCKRILPTGLYNALLRARSPYTRLLDGRWVKLEMISSMGNGFTFPLQTIIFSAVISVAYDSIYGMYPHKGRIFVFGDDMVVRREAYDRVVDLLGLCGFFVNGLKSFSSGPFRESCGGDFYEGTSVRAVYIQTLSNRAAVYHAFNSIRRWGLYHRVPCFRLLLALRRLLPRSNKTKGDVLDYVPFGSPSDWGLWCERRQAARYATHFFAVANGEVVIKRTLVRSRSVELIESAGWNVDGAFIAAASGRVVPDADGGVSRIPKKVRTRCVRDWHVTSVWPTADQISFADLVKVGERVVYDPVLLRFVVHGLGPI